jgi:hypothetical protein
MKGKRQTTIAKLARERRVQERRDLKREKKQAAAAAAREARADTNHVTERSSDVAEQR